MKDPNRPLLTIDSNNRAAHVVINVTTPKSTSFKVKTPKRKTIKKEEEEEKKLNACCFSLTFDQTIQDCLENYWIINLIFNRTPAFIGASCSLLIATKHGVFRWAYPNPIGMGITATGSFISNLATLLHFNISKTIKESRDARRLFRQLSGWAEYGCWSLWYFLWSSCLLGGVGQGQLTAGGVLPLHLPDLPAVRVSIFAAAYVGYVLSRMSSIPRFFKRLIGFFTGEKPDYLYTEPENLPDDERGFYVISQFQSLCFAIASVWVMWDMYELKWLSGWNNTFKTDFCAVPNCSDASTPTRLAAFFPATINVISFHFSQEGGIYLAYRTCKLFMRVQHIKHRYNQKSNFQKVLFNVYLTGCWSLIIGLPTLISFVSIQGLLDPSSREELPYEIGLPYFLLVNATAMWREMEERFRKALEAPSLPLSDISAEEGITKLPGFFSSPHENRESTTGASLTFTQNGTSPQTQTKKSDWGIWRGLNSIFSCCLSRRRLTPRRASVGGSSYSRL